MFEVVEQRIRGGSRGRMPFLDGSGECRQVLLHTGMLAEMLADGAARAEWKANALAFAETADIYSNAERAADLIQKGAR